MKKEHQPSLSLLTGLTNELMMLVMESGKIQTNPQARQVLDEVLQILIRICNRLQNSQSRYVVAVVGLSNVGKSTLLNALLGSELAPRRNGPCTAAPIEFEYGDRLQVTAYHYGSIHRPSWNCENAEEIHQHLSKLADDSGAEASRSIQRVVVQAPHRLLQNGLVIADTPGFGAAQLGQNAGSHEEALQQYLSEHISQVFWIVMAEQGIGEREVNFRDRFFGDICDDIIVNCRGEWDQNDQTRFKQRYASRLSQQMLQYQFVSGLEGLEARKTADTEVLESSGVTALEKRIYKLTDSAGRTRSLSQTLHQLCVDLGFWFHSARNLNSHAPRPSWRPDSWLRWTEVAKCSHFGVELAKALKGSA